MLRRLLSTVAALAASAEEEHLSLLQTQVERFAKKSADSLAQAEEEEESLAHAGEESQHSACGFGNGALNAGADLGGAVVASIEMAVEHCDKTPGCAGFTYEGGHAQSNMGDFKRIYYKSAFSLNTGANGWSAYKKCPCGFSNGALNAGADLGGAVVASISMAVEHCEKTSGCAGFTYSGGHAQSNMGDFKTIYYKSAFSMNSGSGANGWSAYKKCPCGFRSGALASGSSSGTVVATIKMAIAHCDADAACAGFTYDGGHANLDAWKQIHYKSVFQDSPGNTAATTWSSYKSCPGKYHQECWTAGGCDDDGAKVCDWCGHKNGKQMYCCSGQAARWLGPGGYPSGHKCHNSKFKTGAGYNGHHHCVLPR